MALWGHTELGPHCLLVSLCTRVSHGSNVTDFKPRGLSALVAVVQWAPWETRLFTHRFSLIWIRPHWTLSLWLDMEKGGGGVDGGGGEWGGRRGDARHLDKNDLQWTPRRMRVIKGRGRDRDRGSLDTWTHRQSLLHRKTNFLWSPTWNPPCFTTQMWLSKKGIWGETFDKT